jgi:hypothetical protein
MVDMTPGMFAEAVSNLTERVEELTAKVEGDGGSGASSHNLESRLRAVEGVLGDVRKAVSGLAQKKAASDAQTQLRRPWHMLTAEQAEKRWLDLRAWVEFLVERNNIGSKEIPDCWYLHGGLVDELEALRWAWLETNKPDSKLTEPIWWREALHRARTRWASFNPNGCTSTHSETRSRALPGDRAWSDFLAEELADRPADRPAARAS